MDEKPEQDREELERLRSEIQRLRREREFFIAEHRWGARLVARIVIGARLNKSIGQWLSRASLKDPFPVEETSNLIAAVIRRILAVGLLALIPTAILFWQTTLIRDQNKYFREQTEELRKQIAIQEEQGDLVRRKDLLQAIYDGKKAGLSMRVRTESLKALIALDAKLIDQGRLGNSQVDARGIDLACDKAKNEECADLSYLPLTNIDFTGANLQGSNFSYSDLRDSIFISATLTDADLSGAIIKNAKFREPLGSSLHLMSTPSFHAAVKELEERWKSQGFGKLSISPPGRFDRSWYESIKAADFELSWIILSPESESILNKATKAALINGSTRFLREPFDLRMDDTFLNEKTILPFGVQLSPQLSRVPENYRGRAHLTKISQVQQEVDRVLGKYQFNVFSFLAGPGPETRTVCLPALPFPGPRVFKAPALNLTDFAQLSAKSKATTLRQACRKDLKP